MKRYLAKISFLFLTAALLITAVFAMDEPDAWALEGVSFSVEQGLVAAEDLRPRDAATRAELATMLTRLFRAERASDLSAISDVPPDAWYHDAMAKAVAMGIFQGNGGKLEPEGKLSREQAMTVLSRAFGFPTGDVAALSAYADAHLLGDWAAGDVAALVGAGVVSGSGGKLSPKGQITRQELMVLLQRLCGAVFSGGAIPESGNVLWTAEEAPRNVTIPGDLYLDCANLEPITLQNVVVAGRLVLHGGSVTLQGSTKAQEIVLCGADMTLHTNGAGAVRVTGGSASLSGGGSVTVGAPTTLTGGTWAQAEVVGTTLTVLPGANVTQATLSKKNSIVTGEGTVRAATIYQKNCAVETANTKLEEKIDAGVADVLISATVKANEPKPAAPTIKTTVQFTNVDVTNCRGADQAVRLCTLVWFIDGVQVQKTEDFALTEGVTASLSAAVKYTGKPSAKVTVRVEVRYADESTRLEQTVNRHIDLLPSKIETIKVEATTRCATTLYANMNLTGWLCNLPAGTKATYFNYSGTMSGKVRLSDGRVGWVRWHDLSISQKNYAQATDYTRDQKENYVNIKNYESQTDYLVWISLIKQKVNIFTGKKGDWTLVRSAGCATGKNTTPTIDGVFRYTYRNTSWDFGYYYVKQAMVFNGGHAFHTRTYIKSTGGLLDPTIGKPVSAGCVRMYDEDIYWMVDKLPFRSTVVVY